MKIFDRRSMRRILKLKGHKVTKEIAHQLMWALENDLMDYAANKNVKLSFEWTPSGYILGQVVSSQSSLDIYEKCGITPFDTDIVWLNYKDILWTILHYNEEIERYKKRIDYVAEHTKNI